MPRNITGSEAVSDVLRIMGLPVPASVADSQDATVRQMWQLATEAGQQLISDHEWSFLAKEFQIVTQPFVTTYPVPFDWDKFTPDAMWNRTARLPVLGALQPWEWQMLKARNVAGTTFAIMLRVTLQSGSPAIEFYEAPSTSQTIILPYRSRGWSYDPNSGAADDKLINNASIVLYDSQLFKLKLKLLWLQEKKFDTTQAQAQFDEMLSREKAGDSPARTLSMRIDGGFPYIGVLNTPDTRYGS